MQMKKELFMLKKKNNKVKKFKIKIKLMKLFTKINKNNNNKKNKILKSLFNWRNKKMKINNITILKCKMMNYLFKLYLKQILRQKKVYKMNSKIIIIDKNKNSIKNQIPFKKNKIKQNIL